MAMFRAPSGEAATAGPGVFSRQASGLVRAGGALDVFIFNVGLVSIGIGVIYNQFFGPSSYPGARPAVGTMIACLGMLPVGAVFYLFTVIFPRSGGVYVFLSRTISPGVAFVLSLVETLVFVYSAGLALSLVATAGVSPFLATVGAVAGSPTLRDWAAATGSADGKFWIGMVVLVLGGLLMTSGTRRYFAVQKVLFAVAVAGLATFAVLLAMGSRDAFAANLSRVGGLDYDKVINVAEANGFSHPGFSLGASLSFVVFGWLALSGGVTSVALGGEIKRVRRSQLVGMFGALIFCALVISLFDLLATHAFGDTFQGAVAFNSLNGIADGSTESTVGASPYITVLAGILAGNIPLAVIILFTFVVWIWFWIPAIIGYTTRSMIAWSFDRVAPDRLGYVSARFHTPVVAIWTLVAGTAALLWLIAYQNLALLKVNEMLTVVWGMVPLAAMMFPYLRRGLYQTSPVAGLRLFGLPLMSVAGFVALVYSCWVGYLLWTDPVAAGPLIMSPLPLEFWIVTGTVIVGALWYAGAKAYRARHGIDIRLAFQQIPIE